MRKIALDLGLRKIVLAERLQGQMHLQTFKSLKALKTYLGGNVASAEVAFEACAGGWALAKWLKGHKHTPQMIDTTRLTEIGIGRHGRKTDEIDAELILVAMEQGRLALAHIMSDESHRLRQQLKIREQLVQQRAKIKTLVKQLIRSEGEEFSRSYDAERLHEVLQATKLTACTRMLLQPYVDVVQALNAQIEIVNKKIAQLGADKPQIRQLCSVPGVGPVVASTFVAVIDNALRFKSAHHVQSFLGLVPCEYSSGGKQQFGRISKAGNEYMRSLLVQAAWGVMHKRGDDNDPLRAWALRVAQRRGRSIAIVALARRLAGILWALWRDGNVYEPLRLHASSWRGLREQEQPLNIKEQALQAVAKKLQKRAVWQQLMA